MPRKKREKTVNLEVTFKTNLIIREGVSVYDLLFKETEFIAEPQSTNGCVTSMEVIGIKKI